MSLRDRIGSAFKSRDEFDLTSGGIARPLFYLSLPIVVTNLMQTAYNLADTFWLGQYSTEALAAISFAFPMVFLLIALGLGVSVAGSVLVAQYVGAGEERRAEYAAAQTVTFAVIFSVVLGAVGYFAVGDFLALLGASPDVLPLAARYMRVYSLGIVFVFGFFVFVSLMRGYGDTITPMLVMFGSVALNVALDPFLIFGFDANPLFAPLGLGGLQAWLFDATGFVGWGVEGAAIATVFSRALAFLVGLAVMYRGARGVRIRVGDLLPDLEYAVKLARIGVPASVEGTVRALSVNLLLVIVGLFPTTVVAAYGVGTRVFSVIFLPAIAISQGVETMTGQNVGARKPDRAERSNHVAAVTLFVVLSAMGVVIWLAARPIVAVFTDDPAVVETGAEFLRYVAPTFGGLGIVRAYSGGFRGAGRTMVAAAISVLTLGIIRLPVAWVAAVGVSLTWATSWGLPLGWASFGGLGATGIWLSFAVSNVAGAVLAYVWFKRGTWRDAGYAGGPRGTSPQTEVTGDD